jgi:hypothetical protein
MDSSLGPWSTAIHSGSQARLSTFWKRRLVMLPMLAGGATGRHRLAVGLLATLLLGLPLVHGKPLVGDEEKKEPPTAPKSAEPPEVQPPAGAVRPPPAERAPKDVEPAEVQRARQAFHKVFGLAEGEVLKCILPPFPRERADYFDLVLKKDDYKPDKIAQPLRVQFWEWANGELRRAFAYWSVQDDVPLVSLLQPIAGILPSEIEGDGTGLLDKHVQADFVIRKGAAKDKLLAQFAAILRRDFKVPVKLSYREVEREVFVARGTFPADKTLGSPEKPVLIYGKKPPAKDEGFWANGGLDGLLNQLGLYVGKRIINEVKPGAVPVTYAFRGEDRHQEGAEVKAVLDRVAEQTGLTFKPEKRRVHVLFVEREER